VGKVNHVGSVSKGNAFEGSSPSLSSIKRLVKKWVERASHTMTLEGQALTEEENKKMYKEWVEKLK